LWYVWAGRGTMQLRRGRTVNLHAGVLIWARPGGTYLARQDPDERLGVSSVHFDVEPGFEPPDEVHLMRDPGYGGAVLDRIIELHDSDGDAIAMPLLTGLGRDIISGRCTRSPDRGGTRQHHEQVAHAVAAELREHETQDADPPDIASIAHRHGYSPDHLTRVFRDVLGTTLRDYIIDHRLARARRLLDESAMSVAQIADVLGYHSPGHFCRQFKQRLGQSPGKYRKTPRIY